MFRVSNCFVNDTPVKKLSEVIFLPRRKYGSANFVSTNCHEGVEDRVSSLAKYDEKPFIIYTTLSKDLLLITCTFVIGELIFFNREKDPFVTINYICSLPVNWTGIRRNKYTLCRILKLQSREGSRFEIRVYDIEYIRVISFVIVGINWKKIIVRTDQLRIRLPIV